MPKPTVTRTRKVSSPAAIGTATIAGAARMAAKGMGGV